MEPEENGTEGQTVTGRATAVEAEARAQAPTNVYDVLDQHDLTQRGDPSQGMTIPLPRTALAGLSGERSRPPGTDGGAYRRLARSQTKESFVAVCFPRGDLGFAERVQMLFDGTHPEGPFAAAVQALLRETYPLAVISPRHEFAALDGRRVWYAFRDGSAVPSVEGDTP